MNALFEFYIEKSSSCAHLLQAKTNISSAALLSTSNLMAHNRLTGLLPQTLSHFECFLYIMLKQ